MPVFGIVVRDIRTIPQAMLHRKLKVFRSRHPGFATSARTYHGDLGGYASAWADRSAARMIPGIVKHATFEGLLFGDHLLLPFGSVFGGVFIDYQRM